LLAKVTGMRVIGTVSALPSQDHQSWYLRQGILVGGAVSLLLIVLMLNLVLSDRLRAVLRSVTG